MTFEEFEEMRIVKERELRQLRQSSWDWRKFDPRKNGYPRTVSMREREYVEMLLAPVEDLFG